MFKSIFTHMNEDPNAPKHMRLGAFASLASVCLDAARELFSSMDSVLDSYDGFGASDSEPRNYLATTINQEFGVTI